MAKVTRRKVYDGECYVIECAVRADGVTSPASAFLEHLSQGTWVEDPDFGGKIPDDAQIGDYDKLLTFFQILADEGEPAYAGAVNSLNDGIWEFRIGAKRLSFFDTAGDGSYTPKNRPESAAAASKGKYYWFPDFDVFVRLGHAFPKTGQRTTGEDIDETLIVREEDIQHDKQ